MEHSFDVEVAKMYSVLEAILIRQFQSWWDFGPVHKDLIRRRVYYYTDIQFDKVLSSLESKGVVIKKGEDSYELDDAWFVVGEIPRPKKKKIDDEFCQRVVDCFCQITGKVAELTPNRKTLINARLKEITRVKDPFLSFEAVFKFKNNQWKGDAEMSKYIRLETFLEPSKFHKYRDEAREAYMVEIAKKETKKEEMVNPLEGKVKDWD